MHSYAPSAPQSYAPSQPQSYAPSVPQSSAEPQSSAGSATHQRTAGGSTVALDSVIYLSSYLPTIFGITFLGLASERHAPKDVPWFLGGMAGMVCLGYAFLFCLGISARSPDLCKVLMIIRIALAALFSIGGGVLFRKAITSSQAMWYCTAFFSNAFSSLPEAFLLYTYASVVSVEARAHSGNQSEMMQMQQLPASQALMGGIQSQFAPPMSGFAPPMGGIVSGQYMAPPPPAAGGFGLPPASNPGYDAPPQGWQARY